MSPEQDVSLLQGKEEVMDFNLNTRVMYYYFPGEARIRKV